jgi:hypothetical protein
MDNRRMSDASTDTMNGRMKTRYVDETDIYEELWRGRDLEINSLWQRSIFLGAFLILAYTGYGTLWFSLLQQKTEILYLLLSNSPAAFFLSLGFFILSGFGLAISVLWIQMAKGSKRWYERYEQSISLIINDPTLENRVFSFPHQQENKTGLPMHGYLKDADCNDSLFSTKAGKYSVSKVNIAIGQVAFVIWRLLLILHSFLLLIQIYTGYFGPDWTNQRTVVNFIMVIAGILATSLGIIPLINICTKNTKSSS